jgi:hypothetical protein
MKKRILLAVLALGLVVVPTSAADHVQFPSELEDTLTLLPNGSVPTPAGSEADLHSPNMFLVSNWDHDGTYRLGSDLAFWGTTAVLGNYGTPGGFRLLDIADPSRPSLIGQLSCPGSQADVSIWRSLVFVSVDSPRSAPQCGAGGASSTAVAAGQAYEGIRVVSIDNPASPEQIGFVDTDCGSHTHTLVPDEAHARVLIYVLSYPLGVPGPDCSAATHRKISVVEVPLTNPTAARVVSTPDMGPVIGCHDVTVFLERKIAAAACISESQIWDLADPVHPRIVSHIVNPAINIHHSTTFSWDGKTAVIGDELAGAEFTPGCVAGDSHMPLGALWFYDVSNPAAPVAKASYSLPQREISLLCTAHNFNTIPLRSGKDVLASAWYNGGTTVVDFTDPANPTQLGYYIGKQPKVSTAWSSYWYNGFIYANNFDEDLNSLTERSRGFDVMAIGHPDLKYASKLKRLNPQTMEPFVGDSKAIG